MTDSPVAKWHKNTWILGDIVTRDGAEYLVSSSNEKVKVKPGDLSLIKLTEQPLLAWYLDGKDVYSWPDDSLEIVLKILEITNAPMAENEIKKAVAELKISTTNFKQDFASIAVPLSEHPHVVAKNRPARWSWVHDPSLKIGSRTAEDVFSDFLRVKNKDLGPILRSEIESRFQEFTDSQRLCLWANGFDVSITGDIALDELPKEFVEPIFALILIKPGLPAIVSAKLLFGLQAKKALSEKLKSVASSKELPVVLELIYSTGQEDWFEALAKNIDGLWENQDLFVQVAKRLQGKSRVEKSLNNQLKTMLNEIATGERKIKSLSPDLFDYLISKITILKSNDLRMIVREELVTVATATLSPRGIKNLDWLSRLSLDELNAILNKDAIAAYFRKSDFGKNFIPDLYEKTIKRLVNESKVDRRGAASIMQIRPEILAVLKETTQAFFRILLSKDPLSSDLVSDHALTAELDKLGSENNRIQSEIRNREREVEVLADKVSALESIVVDYEKSRSSSLSSQANSVARDRAQGSIDVIRQWTANLSQVLKEFQGLPLEPRTKAYDRLFGDLVQYSIVPIEKMDEIVRFDPNKHDLLSPSSTGNGKVISPGWLWNNNGSEVMIAKSVLIPE